MQYRNKQTGEEVDPYKLRGGGCWVDNMKDGIGEYFSSQEFQERFEPVEQMMICPKALNKTCGNYAGCTIKSDKPHKYNGWCDVVDGECPGCIPYKPEKKEPVNPCVSCDLDCMKEHDGENCITYQETVTKPNIKEQIADKIREWWCDSNCTCCAEEATTQILSLIEQDKQIQAVEDGLAENPYKPTPLRDFDDTYQAMHDGFNEGTKAQKALDDKQLETILNAKQKYFEIALSQAKQEKRELTEKIFHNIRSFLFYVEGSINPEIDFVALDLLESKTLEELK